MKRIPSLTTCSPGDIVLSRFPFTDLRSSKKRPVLVLSPDEYSNRYGDIVGLALTTKPQPDDRLRLNHWKSAGLPRETWLKPTIATFKTAFLTKRIGALPAEEYPRVGIALDQLIDLNLFSRPTRLPTLKPAS